METRDEIDMRLRAYVKSLCAPIWWEKDRQTVVHSGSMCVIKTAERLFGVTNCHVLKAYEKEKDKGEDIFCQLGSAPFDPVANELCRSEHWDLATFSIPDETLENFNRKVWTPSAWPPTPITIEDTVVYGGYPEDRRTVAPGVNPKTMTADFVSFLGRPNNATVEDVSFQIDLENLTWLPNVENPLGKAADLGGISGGPCFRLIPAENRIELSAFIHEGRWNIAVIFARQASVISATGDLAPVPPGVRARVLHPPEEE